MLLLAIIMLTGCPNEDPVKPDLCDGKLPFKADFTIYEQPGWLDTMFVADTVLRGNTVHFIANGDYDTYRWTVGTQELEYYTKSFMLKFQEEYSDVDVRLIATKKVDSLCFPNDRTIDTVIKQVTSIAGRWVENPNWALRGFWRGCTDKDPLDTFTVEIGYKMSYDNNGKFYADFKYINNLNNGCVALWQFPDGREYPLIDLIGCYRAAVIDGRNFFNNGCNDPYGYVTLKKDHSEITIEYDQRKNIKGHYIFKGKKVK
jgi:hypothetical protein